MIEFSVGFYVRFILLTLYSASVFLQCSDKGVVIIEHLTIVA